MKNLETKDLIIRKFEIRDVEEAYKNWANDEGIANRVSFRAHRSIEETRGIIQSCINEAENGEPVWGLEEKSSKTIIGYIRTLDMSLKNKTTKLIFGIGQKWREKGYLEDALLEVCKYLVTEEDLELIYVNIYNEHNDIAKKKEEILLKIGMVKEAILRNRRINSITNEVENLSIYSFTKDEVLQKMKMNNNYSKVS